MNDVTVYGTTTCPWCGAARMLLTKQGVKFTDKLVDKEPELRAEMERLTGGRSVPQIVIGERAIGGYDDLKRLADNGELEKILAAD